MLLGLRDMSSGIATRQACFRFSTTLLAWAIVLPSMAGCATFSGGIADVVAVVKGKIESKEGRDEVGNPVACRLDLFRDGTPKAVRSVRVEGQFLQHFGLAPGRYYFEIACDPSTAPVRSAVYDITDMRYHRTPIDLGVIPAP